MDFVEALLFYINLNSPGRTTSSLTSCFRQVVMSSQIDRQLRLLYHPIAGPNNKLINALLTLCLFNSVKNGTVLNLNCCNNGNELVRLDFFLVAKSPLSQIYTVHFHTVCYTCGMNLLHNYGLDSFYGWNLIFYKFKNGKGSLDWSKACMTRLSWFLCQWLRKMHPMTNQDTIMN